MFLKVFVEGDPNIKVTSARNAEDILELVQTGAYDCLISDYDMPDMNGITLAKKIRETSDIPIIIYTGRGSEEVAELAYSAGINDYIRKESHPAHYQVLAKRIRHAVEKRRDEKEVIRLATFPQLNPNPVVEVDLTGKIHYMNPAARREFPDTFRLIETGSKALNWREIVSELRTSEKTVTRDIKIEGVWYSFSFHLVHGSDRLRFYASNIDERKKGEEALRESEERYRALVENSPYAISVTVEDKIVYANPSRAKLAGFEDASKLIGSSSQFQMTEKDRTKLVKRRKLRERGISPSTPFEFCLVDSNGSNKYVIDYSSEIVYDGVKALQHMLMDVTEHKLFVERMEALHRNELELARAKSLDEVADLTLNAIERTLGYNRCYMGFVEGELLQFKHSRGVSGVVNMPLSGRGITVRAVRTGETQLVPDVRRAEDFVEVIKDSYPVLSEMAVPVKINGQVLAVLNLESAKLDAYTPEDQKLVEILAENVASAISRINQLKVIKESEETYRTLLNSSMELVAFVTGTTITYINDWALKLLGYDSSNDLIGKDISQVVSREVLPVIRERALSRQRGEAQPDRYELKLMAKSGRIVPVDASISLISKHGMLSILVIGRSMAEMNRHKRQMTALHRHASRLAEAKTRDEVLEATLEAAESVVGYHTLSVLEPRGNSLVLTHTRGPSLPDVKLPLSGKGLTVRVAKEKRSILTFDTDVNPDYVRGSTDSKSELDVPLVVNGETVAVINLESEEQNAFDEMDKELIETLAIHVSSALQRINKEANRIPRRARRGVGGDGAAG